METRRSGGFGEPPISSPMTPEEKRVFGLYELQMSEPVIGPAEVVKAQAWARVRRTDLDKWEAQLERAVNAERHAARLARDLEEARKEAANERQLRDASWAASAQKDREYRAAQHSAGLLAMLAVAGWAAFAVAAAVAVWR